ncbi:MAG: hypothetical protein EA378_03380 [Phycisphaerales bacterium]|nr:MAG: hypothetical protein EA378_03380 [Phycisphaerales bacterium]
MDADEVVVGERVGLGAGSGKGGDVVVVAGEADLSDAGAVGGESDAETELARGPEPAELVEVVGEVGVDEPGLEGGGRGRARSRLGGGLGFGGGFARGIGGVWQVGAGIAGDGLRRGLRRGLRGLGLGRARRLGLVVPASVDRRWSRGASAVASACWRAASRVAVRGLAVLLTNAQTTISPTAIATSGTARRSALFGFFGMAGWISAGRRGRRPGERGAKGESLGEGGGVGGARHEALGTRHERGEGA